MQHFYKLLSTSLQQLQLRHAQGVTGKAICFCIWGFQTCAWFSIKYLSFGKKKYAQLNYESVMERVFENRVLRRISGPKRDEVTEEWKIA
jgi:hypothetical protein